jgi:hypothetical protein
MTRKTIADYADDSVRWTGIPKYINFAAENRPRRYHLRIPPIITLSMASVGLTILLVDRHHYWLGYSLLMLGFVIGNFLPIFGPVKPWGDSVRVDEWDRQLRHNAYFFTFAAISGVAVAGTWLLCWLALSRAWTGTDIARALSSVAFYLMALLSGLPTLYASWATRPIDDEDDA